MPSQPGKMTGWLSELSGFPDSQTGGFDLLTLSGAVDADAAKSLTSLQSQ